MLTNLEFHSLQFSILKNDLLDKYKFVYESEIRVPITSDITSILFVELEGNRQYPRFQFTSDGMVFPVLQKVLPRLLQCRSDWDVLFWLTTERTVMIDKAVPTDDQMKNLNSLEDVMKLGEKVYFQSTYLTSTPLKLLEGGKDAIFQIFCEDLLNPDERIIIEKRLLPE